MEKPEPDEGMSIDVEQEMEVLIEDFESRRLMRSRIDWWHLGAANFIRDNELQAEFFRWVAERTEPVDLLPAEQALPSSLLPVAQDLGGMHGAQIMCNMKDSQDSYYVEGFCYLAFVDNLSMTGFNLNNVGYYAIGTSLFEDDNIHGPYYAYLHLNKEELKQLREEKHRLNIHEMSMGVFWFLKGKGISFDSFKR